MWQICNICWTWVARLVTMPSGRRPTRVVPTGDEFHDLEKRTTPPLPRTPPSQGESLFRYDPGHARGIRRGRRTRSRQRSGQGPPSEAGREAQGASRRPVGSDGQDGRPAQCQVAAGQCSIRRLHRRDAGAGNGPGGFLFRPRFLGGDRRQACRGHRVG